MTMHDEVLAAQRGLEAAQRNFDNADVNFIDAAIYALKAAENRYNEVIKNEKRSFDCGGTDDSCHRSCLLRRHKL